MSKKDLFIILVKVFGLFLLFQSVSFIFPNILTFTLLSISGIISVTLQILAFYLLIIKAEKIVAFLKLDQGFEDKGVSFKNFSPIVVLYYGTFLVGGYMVVSNFSKILVAFFHWYTREVNSYDSLVYWNIYTTTDVVEFVLGIVIIGNYRKIAQLIDRRSQSE